WAIFVAAAGVVAAVCVAILRPFANVIAWSAVLAILCYPVQMALVRRTGRVGLSAFLTSIIAVFACLVPLLALMGVAVNECVALAHSFPASFPHGAVARASALIARIGRPVGLDQATIASWTQQRLGDLGGGAAKSTLTIATG